MGEMRMDEELKKHIVKLMQEHRKKFAPASDLYTKERFWVYDAYDPKVEYERRTNEFAMAELMRIQRQKLKELEEK